MQTENMIDNCRKCLSELAINVIKTSEAQEKKRSIIIDLIIRSLIALNEFYQLFYRKPFQKIHLAIYIHNLPFKFTFFIAKWSRNK